MITKVQFQSANSAHKEDKEFNKLVERYRTNYFIDMAGLDCEWGYESIDIPEEIKKEIAEEYKKLVGKTIENSTEDSTEKQIEENKNIISKELFIEIINSIEESYNWDKKLNDLVYYGNYFNPLADILIKTVSKAMGLRTEEHDIISWWCYELDFGEEAQESIMIDKKYIDISTPEKFYDYIIEYEIKDGDTND